MKKFLILFLVIGNIGISLSNSSLFLTDSTKRFYYEVKLDVDFNYKNLKLLNGNYRVYFNSSLIGDYFDINTNHNMIDGLVKKFDSAGFIQFAGKYNNDSLWTLFSNENDTTFKIGLWWYRKDSLVKYKTNSQLSHISKENISYYPNGEVKIQKVCSNSDICDYILYNVNGNIEKSFSSINDSCFLTISYNSKGALKKLILDNNNSKTVLEIDSSHSYIRIDESEKIMDFEFDKTNFFRGVIRKSQDNFAHIYLNKNKLISISIKRKLFENKYRKFYL